jgi:photosystem II stability/assembly factor-like uncharacterized protein
MRFQISNLRLFRATTRRRLPSAPAVCSCLLLLLSAFCLPSSAQAAWAKQKSGSFAWLHAVFFVDDARGWAVGGKGALLATKDGGAHWALRRPPTEDAMRDLVFTDAETGWALCERSMYMPMLKEEARTYLLKTTNGGESWKRVDVLSGPDVDIVLARVRFADERHGWVFGEMGALFATEDGGGSWTRQRVPSRHLLLGATFLDARQGWLVGAGSTLLQTSDGGTSWKAGALAGLPQQISVQASAQTNATQQSAPRLRLNAVSFADARRGWAVGAGGVVLATSDGGRTWRAQSSGTESELFDVKFFDEREGRAVGADGVAIHTSDGGATWSAETTGTSHALERLFFTGRARGWAVGFGGTIIAFKQ